LKVRRISFLGVRTGDFDQVTAFVRDVPRMKPSHLEDGWAIFPLELGRRDFLEPYGRANGDERMFPRGSEGPTAALATARPEYAGRMAATCPTCRRVVMAGWGKTWRWASSGKG